MRNEFQLMAPKRYCRLILRLVLAALSAVALFNLLVDPLGAYRWVSLEGFEAQRATLFSRVARGELAGRGPWDMVVFGTSRPKAGLSSRHPVFSTNRVCNLAVDGARMSEASAMLDYIRARQPIRHALLFLDFAMFRGSNSFKYDFAQSRFYPDLASFEYHCKNLISAEATDRSWEFLSERLRGHAPPTGQTNGFYVHSVRARTAQRELFERVLRSHACSYAVMQAAPEQMQQLRHFLRSCRDNDIECTLAINPVHALDLELLRAGGNWERFEQWKREVVATVAAEDAARRIILWDFSGYSSFTAEEVPAPANANTRMKHYFESSHYTPATGAIMLDRMFSNATNDFGVRITIGNIEAHLKEIRQQREDYAGGHAAEIQWVQDISRQEITARKAAVTGSDDVE